MPSTLVHVGFGALIGTALLSDYFDSRAVLLVMGLAAFPDLDTFVGLWLVDGGHRTVLHNLVLPFALLAAIWWDVERREESFILRRYGAYGYRVVWVGILGGWITAHVLLDAFHNGVNVLWPFHDEFVDLSGHLLISDERGLEQTFLEFETAEDGSRAVSEGDSFGSSDEMHYYTGADPGPGADEDAERWFYLFDRGEFAVLALTGYLAAAWRIVGERREATGRTDRS